MAYMNGGVIAVLIGALVVDCTIIAIAFKSFLKK